jgi:DNA modification methylase
MKTLPCASIDCIATDPPYNVSVEGARIVRGSGTIYKGPDINLDFGEWDRNKIGWKDFIDRFVELLTPNGVLIMFYDKLYLGSIGIYLQEKYGFQVRHIGAMVKKNPAPQGRRVKWQNGLEQFLIATKNKGEGHHFNYRLGQSPDYFMTDVNYKHSHPTQKPLEIMSWLIRYWSFEGDTILDPFMGSGTTGVACIKYNRNFLGCEISPEYFEIAKDYIEKANLQPPLHEYSKKNGDSPSQPDLW